jgi:hypothetical protein
MLTALGHYQLQKPCSLPLSRITPWHFQLHGTYHAVSTTHSSYFTHGTEGAACTCERHIDDGLEERRVCKVHERTFQERVQVHVYYRGITEGTTHPCAMQLYPQTCKEGTSLQTLLSGYSVAEPTHHLSVSSQKDGPP